MATVYRSPEGILSSAEMMSEYDEQIEAFWKRTAALETIADVGEAWLADVGISDPDSKEGYGEIRTLAAKQRNQIEAMRAIRRSYVPEQVTLL